MKKILALVLCFALAFCLFGCTDKEDDKKSNEEKELSEKNTANVTVGAENIETQTQEVEVAVQTYDDIPDKSKFVFFYNNGINVWMNYLPVTDYEFYPDVIVDVDENGNVVTFHQAATKYSLNAMAETDFYFEKAKAEGFVGSDKIEKAVRDYLNEFKQNIKNTGYSLNEYIELMYNGTITVEYWRTLIYIQYYVDEYIECLEKNIDITDEELYEHKETYSEELIRVDFRLFDFEIDAYGEDEVAELAQKMCDRITDEESFVDLAYEYCAEDDKDTFKEDGATYAKGIRKSVVESNIGKDLADWLYANERQAGDKIVYTTDQYVYVVYIINTAYFETAPLVDARHILISFDEVVKELNETAGNSIDTSLNYDRETETLTLEDGKEITNENTGYSIELVEEAYNISKNIYEEYLKGAKTEESFAELAEKNSDDTGSIGEGGLYEDIEKGKMVAPFEDWSYDENRKTGDVDIIMTEYGWHIMYFVKQHEEAFWKEELREIIATEEFDDILDSFEKEISELAEEYAEELPVDEYSETALDTFWN